MSFLTEYPEVKNYIGGQFVSNGQERRDVVSPLNGRKLSSAPMSSRKDLDEAVVAATAAYKLWSQVPIKERVQVFFRYKTLMETHIMELAQLVHDENGKTLDEARAEIEKSIELTEFACSMPQLIAGEVMEVSRGVECRTEKKPLGVVASIAPFNFPHMVPHWTVPNAIVLGNTMILKPSEIVPISAIKMANMLKEAGLPDGVFNIVNGGQEIVEAICDHPGIQAVSFVGSTKVAQIVYRRSTQALKRCCALGGAKNHLFVFPDAHVDMTASNVLASMSGCAGQRCMAAASMVGVGPVDHIIAKMVEEVRKIVPGENLGAVISPAAKARIEGFITEAEKQGAKILVDGRNTVVKGMEGGNYVGPTIIDFVTPDMRIAQEEVFGPVISIIRAKNMDEAISIENANPYGNAAAVFTQSGGIAREVMERASAGMIGVNIGVPVPREPFSFGGWNDSRFGANDITGKSSIDFWTQIKKTTIKWNPEAKTNWMS
ncbi:MAG: CoA-acylating methylmalonate-semialdehyde dehydrogenase [Bacteroidetes bacterium]|nr:CoA-acylating methylmalonate-semialdehyde dehydrogenase [Bacteroidota bacterium]